jgi:hypothetical protein
MCLFIVLNFVFSCTSMVQNWIAFNKQTYVFKNCSWTVWLYGNISCMITDTRCTNASLDIHVPWFESCFWVYQVCLGSVSCAFTSACGYVLAGICVFSWNHEPYISTPHTSFVLFIYLLIYLISYSLFCLCYMNLCLTKQGFYLL